MNRNEALRLARTAREEAGRALSYLRRGDDPRVFYVSHLIRDEEMFRVEARFGTVFQQRHEQNRACYTDVRVGSYRFDQVQHGGLHDNSKDDESYNYADLPTGSDRDGLRHGLWKLTDARYREAVETFLRKRAEELTYVNRNRELRSFEKRAGIEDVGWRRLPDFDTEEWTRFVRRASARLKRHPGIKIGSVLFEAVHTTQAFVNTEGSLIIQRRPLWVLECYLWLLSDSGDGIPWTIQHYVTDPSELPSERAFHREIDARIRLLEELAAAPRVQSFSGPVLLEPKPAGLLIHEAVGHRLEGSRLLSSGEGQTFRDSLGKHVLPEFLSIRDDASIARWNGKSLVGHYPYDDEGIPSGSAQLVDRGVLKGFLTSRAAIAKRHRSNGHGRTARHQRPISRMGVSIVESANGYSDGELKAKLVEEVRRQNVPFGIRIIKADGGETATEGYNFQAFLGEINLASRVFPDGREEWIRGVNFVGTPLNATRSIVASGNRYGVDNAQCGAESGYLPVSTISPALLISRLELQSKSEAPFAQYSYPIPWDDRPPRRRR